ncbi:MAG: tetratricopeptide repeat protein [Gammaproteobacteria bacterium]|nr:tetratricopeptide repeat protein [Gammaproteobacteria bacterium]
MAESDEEQIEAIKRWWDENGTSLIIGVVVAVGGVLGWQAWQNHVEEQGEAAAAIYDDLMEAVVVEGPFSSVDEEARQTGKFLADRLKEEHGGSGYAHFASMFLAKLAVSEGDLEKAESELILAIEDGIDESLLPIATMRLARVQKALGKHEKALETLLSVEPGEHKPTWEEIRGDVYHAMGDRPQAREAYQNALGALDNPGSRPMLQMKLDDLEAAEITVPVEEDEPLANNTPAETEES